MVARVDRTLLIVLLLCQLLDALGTVSVAWVGKQIIDAIVTSLRSAPPHPWRPAVSWVLVELGLVSVIALVGQVQPTRK